MEKTKQNIHEMVKEDYSRVAEGSCASASCCGSNESPGNLSSLSQKLGYSKKDIASVPVGANMGLGCGNPSAIANLKVGETVLDLGCGGGFDCFLAADKVGQEGKVIGIDMTEAMINKAKNNALQGNYTNVEFHLANIEELPLADDSVDVIISNCVVNLSPDKSEVFKEAYRVLKEKGRLAISDVVLLKELPEEIKEEFAYYSGCVTGASNVKELHGYLSNAGFKDVKITPLAASKDFVKEWAPGWNIQDYIVSATIEAVK